MTQDQYGQPRGPGYVVRGDVVPEEENEENRTEQSKPMTAFKKVASALRGDRAGDREDVDEARQDQPAANRAPTGSEEATGSDVMAPDPDAPGANPPYVTEQDEAAMASSPISRETAPKRDYWDEPDAADRQDEAVAVTSPHAAVSQPGTGTADHAATEPDMFGTTRRTGDETAAASAEEQAGAATIADVPGSTTAREAPAGDYPASGVAAGGATASGTTQADTADTGPVDTTAADTTPVDTTAADIAPVETTRPDAPPAGTGAAAEAAGTPAGRDAATPVNGDLRPGEAAGTLGDFSDLTYGNLIPDAEQYTAQWQQIQFRFVDDPQASVTEAADIVAQVTTKLEAAIQERQRAIEERQRVIQEHQRSLRNRWGEGTNADTETMRETLRMYKTFLDQLIGHRAG